MKVIDSMLEDLERVDVSRQARLHGTLFTSTGNQVKWKQGNKIVKLDCLGYESIAEVLVSHFLGFTDLSPDAYVEYIPCVIHEDGRFLGRGCYSYDFKGQYEEVSISKILDNTLSSYAITYDELRDLLYDYVGFDTKSYIDKILCVDSIIRNEDRHFGNIAFLYKDRKFIPAPIYDNGASCMSDVISYPLNESFDKNYKSIHAKPFSTNFKEQIHNVSRILVSRDDFLESVTARSDRGLRAIETLKRGLNEMEGISWEKC